MNLKLRPGTREDAAACGVIDFEAFKLISSEHNFPWDFPSVEAATALTTALLSNPGFYTVVAETDGRIVGSNFLDERNPISGVGPISVDPTSQNQTIGRQLMLAVMERSNQRGFAGKTTLVGALHHRQHQLSADGLVLRGRVHGNRANAGDWIALVKKITADDSSVSLGNHRIESRIRQQSRGQRRGRFN